MPSCLRRAKTSASMRQRGEGAEGLSNAGVRGTSVAAQATAARRSREAGSFTITSFIALGSLHPILTRKAGESLGIGGGGGGGRGTARAAGAGAGEGIGRR